MSGCFNKVVIVGYLGQNPDVRYTRGGTAVCNLSVATERSVKRDGKWESVTVWVRVTVWGARGENVNKYLSKGSKLLVEGELDQNKWEDRNGNKRSDLVIIADKIVFLDSKGDRGGRRSNDSGSRGDDGYNRDYGSNIDDSDLPF